MTDNKFKSAKREIRVFISSTFRDMQEERDHLINRIFPALSREAERRNVTIVPVDLRWGITEEEASQGSVVGICLEQIDQSRPFFIGLIGHRYGWCPTGDDVASFSDRCPRLGMYVDHGFSMTEIEMQYGVLDSDSDTEALFLIKTDSQGDTPDPGILRLRDKVSSQRPDDIAVYKSVDDMGECVRQRLMDLLDRYYPAKEQTPEAAVTDILWSNVEMEAARYIDPNVMTDMPLPESGMRIVQAHPGEGRSMYASARAVALRERSDMAVIYFRSGTDIAVENKKRLFDVIRYQMAALAGMSDDPVLPMMTFPDVVEHLCKRLKDAGRSVVMIIDGAEMMKYLSTFEWRRELLLPFVSNGCYVECTFPDTVLLDPLREMFMYPFGDVRADKVDIPRLDSGSRCRYVNDYLSRFGKKLPEHIVKHLASEPITMRELRFVLDEMVVYGVFETLPDYIDRLLGIESASDRYAHILHRVTGMIPIDEIAPLLAVLAVVYHGVPEFELWHDILRWTPLRWAEVYGVIRTLIGHTPKGLCAVDRDLEQLLKSVTTADDRLSASKAIAAALAGKHTYDSECAVQLYKSSQTDRLWHLLAHDGATLNMLSEGEDYTVWIYWNHLLHKDPLKYSFTPVSESIDDVSQAQMLLAFNHKHFRNAKFVLDVFDRFGNKLIDVETAEVWSYLMRLVPESSRIEWLESMAVYRSILDKNLLTAHYIDAGNMKLAAEWSDKALDDWQYTVISNTYRMKYLADGVEMHLLRAYIRFCDGLIEDAHYELDNADALVPRVGPDTLEHARAVAARCVIDFLWSYRNGIDERDIDLANDAIGRFAELTGYVRSALGDKNPHTLEFERAFCQALLVYGDSVDLAVDEWIDAVSFSDIPVRWRDALLVCGSLPAWLKHIPGVDDCSMADRITAFYCAQIDPEFGHIVGAAAFWNNKLAQQQGIEPAQTAYSAEITEARNAVKALLKYSALVSPYYIAAVWPETVCDYDRMYDIESDIECLEDSKFEDAWGKILSLNQDCTGSVNLRFWFDAIGMNGIIEGVYERMIQLYTSGREQCPEIFASVDLSDTDTLVAATDLPDALQWQKDLLIAMAECMYELEALKLRIKRKALV